MKNRMERYFLVLVLLVLTGCNLKLDGRPGSSNSIEEAKKRKVFLSRYLINANIPVSGEIKAAWIERAWRYTKYDFADTQIAEGDGYQLCANLDERMSIGLFTEWSIKRDSNISSYGIYGKATLVLSLKKVASFDTLRFQIYRGDDKTNPNPTDFIGVLTFVKSEDK